MLIGYARVSTRNQELQVRIDALKAAGCNRVFVEKLSGANRDRPELKASLDFMQEGDALVVWKLDHLARSIRQLVDTAAELATRKIDLCVLDQKIDTASAGGRLIFQVFAAVAEFEQELMLERTHAGLAAARAANRRGGRPRSLDEAKLRRAKALLADPMVTVDEVAQQLGVTQSTLYRHLPGGRSSLTEAA